MNTEDSQDVGGEGAKQLRKTQYSNQNNNKATANNQAARSPSHQLNRNSQSNSPKDSKSSHKSTGGKKVAAALTNPKKSKHGEPEDISQQKSFNASKQNSSDQSLKSNNAKSDHRKHKKEASPVKVNKDDFESLSFRDNDQSFENLPDLAKLKFDFDQQEDAVRRRNYSLENAARVSPAPILAPRHKLIKSKRNKLLQQYNLDPSQGANRPMSPPAKKVIDRMLKNINEKIKRGAYDAFSTNKQTKKQRKYDRQHAKKKGKGNKREKKGVKEDKKKHGVSGGQKTKTHGDELQSDEVQARVLQNTNPKEDREQRQRKIQENARAKLQNERMKLNQSLIKQNSQYQQVVIGGGHHYRSSTNEGSRSVNTFGHIGTKANIGCSGSSDNSPKSHKSMRGSFEGRGEDGQIESDRSGSGMLPADRDRLGHRRLGQHHSQSLGLRFRAGDDSSGNQLKDSQDIVHNQSQIREDESSSNSQFANSMSHSFGSSFYEFKSQQPNNKPRERKDKSELFSKLSNDRRSLLSTPLVEFDSLNQVARHELRSDKLGFPLGRKDFNRYGKEGQLPPSGDGSLNNILSQERRHGQLTVMNLSGSVGTKLQHPRRKQSISFSHNRPEFHTSLSQRPSLGNGGSATPVTPTRQVSFQKNMIDGFPDVEIVQEEILEDDGAKVLNSRGRQGRFKLLHDKNEFNKTTAKRNRSTDFLIENEVDYKTNQISYHNFGDVSEDDEEQISDSSVEKLQTDMNKQQQKKNKTYSIGYLTKKIWKKKIYSDDFDVGEEVLLQNNKMKFQLGSVVNSAIQEDAEISEIENPYFSDNSNSSHLTQKLRKFSLELQKYLDRSDNESSGVISAISMGAQGNKQSKLSHYHSNVNEPIEEVEDEKEEIADQKRQPILESIQRRRTYSRHLESKMAKYFPQSRQTKQIIFESDPIREEIEIEDDELMSENNFYQRWDHHKRFLLTQDEQMKLMNDDARSSNGNPIDKKLYFPGVHKRSSLSGKLHSRRPKRKNKQNSEQQLAPIEEKNEEVKKEDIDGAEADDLEPTANSHTYRRMKTEDISSDIA